MNYCTQCGAKQVQGEMHVCGEIAAASSQGGFGQAANNWGNAATSAVKQVNFNTILGLLKNPQHTTQLEPQRDLIYGILGFAASLLGYMIWVLVIGRKIEEMLGGIFGMFGGFGGYGSSSISAMVIGKLFLLAIISTAALVVTLWFVGNWAGARKLSFNEWITFFGGAQYTFGAGFVISGIIALIQFRLSLLVWVVCIITALAFNILIASERSEVSKERRFTYIAVSMVVYIILVGLLSAIIL